jgi:hypothetical protein
MLDGSAEDLSEVAVGEVASTVSSKGSPEALGAKFELPE